MWRTDACKTASGVLQAIYSRNEPSRTTQGASTRQHMRGGHAGMREEGEGEGGGCYHAGASGLTYPPTPTTTVFISPFNTHCWQWVSSQRADGSGRCFSRLQSDVLALPRYRFVIRWCSCYVIWHAYSTYTVKSIMSQQGYIHLFIYIRVVYEPWTFCPMYLIYKQINISKYIYIKNIYFLFIYIPKLFLTFTLT